MGAAGSSSGASPPATPLGPPSGETFIYGTEESCCPEYTNENIRQRTKTSAFDVGEEPRSQVKFKTNIFIGLENVPNCQLEAGERFTRCIRGVNKL